MTLNIDQESCIKCGKCVRVCPSDIFTQERAGETIGLVRVESCIVCGHCVDVCPTGSVSHSEFPPEKTHTIDYSQMPTPEQVMLLIKSRRSNRTLTSRPVPKEMLDKIVEAAHSAPTATNSQSLSFTVVTDPQKLRQVSDYTIGVFDSLAKLLLNPVVKCVVKPFMKDVYKYVPVFNRLKEEHKAGKDPILRKATALLLIHTPKSNRFGSEDANLAYQNASLMAQHADPRHRRRRYQAGDGAGLAASAGREDGEPPQPDSPRRPHRRSPGGRSRESRRHPAGRDGRLCQLCCPPEHRSASGQKLAGGPLKP